MLDRPSWAPKYIDLEKPSAARIYDYLLGGACNSAADRTVAKEIMSVLPEARRIAQDNRAFLRRTVTYLVSQGVRQFIDIGSGVPTAGNVHEIAQRADRECRVVYVDHDPIAIAHGELLLRDNDRSCAFLADFRSPDSVLRSPKTTKLIDFGQPVALLMFLLLHFVPDQEHPAALIARYRQALAPGSYLALSHPTLEGVTEGVFTATDIVRSSVDEVYPRDAAQVLRLAEGFEPVPPGLVFTQQWRPDGPPEARPPDGPEVVYGLVARKS
ncbi:SAM-dependent methyltransferase [Kutzneria albida]|uniref:S-adenosyl methyltransferase n=1 Tax=Kutzneria albida DSM 43870 TaxID=1449976 RepID=W5W2U5_9PSEU|nr:SAM-dependent methyltransferase [Kutzneria albida]AHH94821.1 hypothetical protein KALB_1448 [Kutzneria albida DSM 43870]